MLIRQYTCERLENLLLLHTIMNSILLSPVGGQAMGGIIRYFKDKKKFIIGLDNNPHAIGRFFVDTFYQVPKVDDSEYRDKILDIIRNTRDLFFISWLDPEINFWNIQYQAGAIPKELVSSFGFNFRKDFSTFYDKYYLSQLIDSQGLATPKTSLVRDYDVDTSYPRILKPRIGFGSRGIVKINSEGELNSLIHSLTRSGSIGEYIIQEFISGEEFTVDFFAQSGNLENCVIRERIEHRGVSLRGEIVFKPEIEDIVERFCKLNKIDGINNLQVIQREQTFYITDFNMRPSGTIMLSIMAGVDLLENVMEKRMGKTITHFGKPKKIKMIRYLSEYYYE